MQNLQHKLIANLHHKIITVSNIHKSVTYSTIQKSNVDRENGIIKDVVIVNSGLDKNGDNIDNIFLNQIAEQGNLQPQGVKSRFDHPNMCATTFGYYVGRYKNFSVAGESVIADLHLDPVSKTSPHGNLYDYIISMSETNADMFGNSIVFAPSQSDKVKEKDTEGNDIITEYIRCKSFIASDIVDSPAATNSLFKSFAIDEIPNAVVLTDFLNENPQLTDLIIKNENLISEFLKKYKSTNQIKKQMANEKENSGLLAEFKSISKSIFAKLGLKSKNISAIGADDVAVSIETENDMPVVGNDVYDMAGNAAPNGDYNCEGYLFTVVDGKVATVTPKEPMTESAPAEVAALETEVKSLKNDISKLASDYEQSQNELKSALTDLKAINEHLVNVKSSFVAPVKDMVSSEKSKSEITNEPTAEAIRQRKEELKKKQSK